METVPPGVTRYPRSLGRGLRVLNPVVDGPLVAVLLALGVLRPLVFGDVDVVRLLGLAVVGVVLPVACVPLHWVLRLTVVVSGALAGFALTASDGRDYTFCWLLSLLAGLLLLMGLVGRRQQRRRAAAAEGAPSSGLNPSGGHAVGRIALWGDAAYLYEAVEPGPEVVLAAVRALDGGDRSAVSVFDDDHRLDVGGDAAGVMVVLQSDDRFNWHVVEDPAQPALPDARAARAAEKLSVTVAGVPTDYPRRRVTDLARAEVAVTAFLLDGGRAPGLTWWAGSFNDPVPRPRALKITD